MLSSAFDLAEQISLRTVTYSLHTMLWEKYTFPSIDLSFIKWHSIKYLNTVGDDLNPEVEKIPAKKGGLYMFYIKCKLISGITDFPFYIGRAQLTDGQNLRKRVKEYFNKYSRDDERPKITRMFKYWGCDLYLAYYPLTDNDEIKDLEKKLINSLLLPMNDEIPDIEIRQAVKAF